MKKAVTSTSIHLQIIPYMKVPQTQQTHKPGQSKLLGVISESISVHCKNLETD